MSHFQFRLRCYFWTPFTRPHNKTTNKWRWHHKHSVRSSKLCRLPGDRCLSVFFFPKIPRFVIHFMCRNQNRCNKYNDICQDGWLADWWAGRSMGRWGNVNRGCHKNPKQFGETKNLFCVYILARNLMPDNVSSCREDALIGRMCSAMSILTVPVGLSTTGAWR